MSIFTSDHFQIEPASTGVYIAFAKPNGCAVSNAGIIDLGNHTLIFDSFLSPTAARDLRSAAIALTGRAPRYVANSHHHLDHCGGNSVFAGEAELVSTTTTQHLLATAALQELRDYQENAQARLQQLEAKSKPSANRRPPQGELLYYRAVVTALPELTLTEPTLCYESKLIFRGSARNAELITFGGGHTQSDSILYIPESDLIFSGDLLAIGHHPYLADGDPGELDRILNQIIKLNPKLLVPGHGLIAETDDIRVLRQYITMLTEVAMRELVYGATDAKDAAHKAENMTPPAPYNSWDFPSYFAENLKFLYRRLLAAYAD